MAQTFREIHQGATEARIEIQEKWFKEKQKDKYLEEDQRPKRQETTTGRMKEYESQVCHDDRWSVLPAATKPLQLILFGMNNPL